jgi:hypothetical protein
VQAPDAPKDPVTAPAINLLQHPDQHRPEGPILLAIDQELGEGALWVAPELADPIGSLEVGEHEDVEKLGAGSGTERIETLPQLLLELIRTHVNRRLRRRRAARDRRRDAWRRRHTLVRCRV